LTKIWQKFDKNLTKIWQKFDKNLTKIWQKFDKKWHKKLTKQNQLNGQIFFRIRSNIKYSHKTFAKHFTTNSRVYLRKYLYLKKPKNKNKKIWNFKCFDKKYSKYIMSSKSSYCCYYRKQDYNYSATLNAQKKHCSMMELTL